jgi:hypothetical protein
MLAVLERADSFEFKPEFQTTPTNIWVVVGNDA